MSRNQLTLGNGGNRPRRGSDKAHEGVIADDYDPDAIGTAELSAGEPVQTWEQYGLELVPILHGGRDTGRRFVRRNGNVLADVSDRYKLLPNERVVEAANEVADQLGAVPFHEHSGDWYVKLDDHVFQDEERRRVHALYSFDERNVGGDGIEYGFAVHNSIDKSCAFEVGLFTFRHACANMVMMGVDGRGMGFDDREVIAHQSHRHTASLDIDNLELVVQASLSLVDNIDETYRTWRNEFLTVEDIKRLIDYFPGKDLPDWIRDIAAKIEAAEEDAHEDNTSLDPEQRESIVRDNMRATESVWQNYNDLTESVWHDDATSDQTKDQKFRKLHRVHAIPGVR